MHSNGTSRSPPGCILMEHATTSRMPEVVSGKFYYGGTIGLFHFHIPSQVQMTPTKFVDVKSVPNMIGCVMCLQTINDCMNGWLFIVKQQVTWPRAPMSSPGAFLTYGWDCKLLFPLLLLQTALFYITSCSAFSCR